MADFAEPSMTIDAELSTPSATAQVVRFQMPGPADNLLRREETYWLDLCLTPRPNNARACYRERWNPNRFERVGKIFLVPPRQTLHARSDGQTSQMSILCHLRPETLRACFDEEVKWTDRGLVAGLDIRDESVRGLLLRLAEETRHPGFASHALVELIAAQLAIEVGRHCLKINEIPIGGGLAPWRLRLIDEVLQETQAIPTLSELAGLCKLSVRQLTRGFRMSRGCSIGDYVANRRIDRAKSLLITDQSVKSIAQSLGFSSPSSFCYAFRRATGATPNEFRRRAPRAS